MLHILDYKKKIRMPIPNEGAFHTLTTGFICLFGSDVDDLVILNDETNIETPFVEFAKSI